MNTAIRERLERGQIAFYLISIGLGLATGILLPAAADTLERAITPVLAALIYTTFLQIPLANLQTTLENKRFLVALLAANFIIVPVLVWALFQAVPDDTAIQIGVLLVLLTPCIDYVVVFTHLGRGDSQLMLVVTPILLIVQILLLPFYLWLFLGPGAAALLHPGPFLAAFLWLIAMPLVLAWLTGLWARRCASGADFIDIMAWGPVPLMALTLFLVIGAEVPRVQDSFGDVIGVIPIYIAYMIVAPMIGYAVARVFGLGAGAGRALIFSTSTRNSLVILPLALAVPFGGGLAAAVVVTQTFVELLSELVYIRIMPRLIVKPANSTIASG